MRSLRAVGVSELHLDLSDARIVPALLEGALDSFRAPGAERGLSFRLDLAPELRGEFFADPGRLRQILLNLLVAIQLNFLQLQ